MTQLSADAEVKDLRDDPRYLNLLPKPEEFAHPLSNRSGFSVSGEARRRTINLGGSHETLETLMATGQRHRHFCTYTRGRRFAQWSNLRLLGRSQ